MYGDDSPTYFIVKIVWERKSIKIILQMNNLLKKRQMLSCARFSGCLMKVPIIATALIRNNLLTILINYGRAKFQQDSKIKGAQTPNLFK